MFNFVFDTIFSLKTSISQSSLRNSQVKQLYEVCTAIIPILQTRTPSLYKVQECGKVA